MNTDFCMICGAEINEGTDVCEACEKEYAPSAEILQAMKYQFPVEHDGINYGCISAYIIRARVNTRCARSKKPIAQVELMSKRGCVVIASPQSVKIIKPYDGGPKSEKIT